MRLLGVAIALLVTAACSATANSGSMMTDPGPGRAADFHGLVVVKGLATINVDGREVMLATPGYQGNCESRSHPCYGFVRLADKGGKAERVSWWSPLPSGGATFEHGTSAVRFQGSRVVIDGGFAIPLSPRFTVERGCNGGATREALLKSRYGVTLFLDRTTAEVVSAGCNGSK
jgi:hypothetical protein